MSLFSKIFAKKNLVAPIDLGVIGVDMHSHFIPGIDDGAKTLEESIELISAMKSFGYKKIITTPHIMSDFYQNTPENINYGLQIIKEELKARSIEIEIEAAAEYYLDGGFEEKVREKKVLSFGRNYLLFEVSYINEPEGVLNAVFNMQIAGYVPVLAHPERYPFWFENMKMFNSLCDKGVLLQLNINSLSGHYGEGPKKTAVQLIENNLISFLGSDCHHHGHLQIIKKVRHDKNLEKLISCGSLLNAGL